MRVGSNLRVCHSDYTTHIRALPTPTTTGVVCHRRHPNHWTVRGGAPVGVCWPRIARNIEGSDARQRSFGALSRAGGSGILEA